MLAAVTLDDKYALDDGRVFLTGIQALVRLPLVQRRRDVAAGLNTGGFISGYRGSPLAAYDRELWRAKPRLEAHHIHFQPGVNEDLAATALWGSQQATLDPQAIYDGVFGLWYGKGPGLDRSGDAMKHGNFAGSDPHGGVLALAGDDHGARSSTLAHQSDHACIHFGMPILNPASVAEFLEYGLLGFALSRFAGCWVGFKCITDVVESGGTVAVDPAHPAIVMPDDFEMPEGGLNILPADTPLGQEARALGPRLDAARAFVAANQMDRIAVGGRHRRLGIVTSGKAYLDVRAALESLGIDRGQAERLGIGVFKVAMPWPLEPSRILDFCANQEEILVVEEKRPIIEDQLARLLFRVDANHRPRLTGKTDESGRSLVPSVGELSADIVARLIVERLEKSGHANTDAMAARLSPPAEVVQPWIAGTTTKLTRLPTFCSGCPHNRSTKVPNGSVATAGIGCHSMAIWLEDRATRSFTQMGGEGLHWVGQAPFTARSHMFQNIGDGTYYHSGLLAIRAAISAGVNITYKLLYNDAVAMTGGQPVEGCLLVPDITRELHAEGVRVITVVSDEPKKYPADAGFAPGVTFHHRDQLDQVQRRLRDTPGVSILIYDQTCAAEKRRRRKRSEFPDPPIRAFINQAVCEGCGDCNEQSNCVSIEPVETMFGRKRRVNQSSCNKDFSCVNGFCPSFVTVHGAEPANPQSRSPLDLDRAMAALPTPEPVSSSDPYSILVAGIGGTGIVTMSALISMAAHLESKHCTSLDLTGIAVKNGAVSGHIKICDSPDPLHGARIAARGTDLLIGCDMIVAANREMVSKYDPERTSAVLNEYVAPTYAFQVRPNLDLDNRRMKRDLAAAIAPHRTSFVDANRLVTGLTGDTMLTNIFLLGFILQMGLLPVGVAAVERAIELNGVSIDVNKRALTLGRLAVHDAGAIEDALSGLPEPTTETVDDSLDNILAHRVAHLTAYQDESYAARCRALVERVARVERAILPTSDELARTVARAHAKLLAYKDEYEVARLYSEPTYWQSLEDTFGSDYKLRLHLAPALFGRRDPVTGQLRKRAFGPWIWPVLRLLARMKSLRGGRFDIFGRTAERRTERRLIGEYEATIEELLAGLTVDNHALAVEIVGLPEQIRGFGHVKERHIETTKARADDLLAQFRSGAVPAMSAAS